MIIYALSKEKMPPGVETSEAIDVPDSATRLTLSAQRDKWPPGKGIITMMLDLSLNGGVTWISPFAGFTTKGGTLRGKTRKDIKNVSFISFEIPPGTNRKVRLVTTLLKHLKTTLTIEAT